MIESFTELIHALVPRHYVLVCVDCEFQLDPLDRTDYSRGIPRELHPAYFRGLLELSCGHLPHVRSVSTGC